MNLKRNVVLTFLNRGFLWRVLAIGAISLVPPYAVKVISRTMKPPSYRKVQST